jgi:hypothetical protein
LRTAFLVADLADDDVGFANRQQGELHVEALAIFVGPCGADLSPVGAFRSDLADSINAMRRPLGLSFDLGRSFGSERAGMAISLPERDRVGTSARSKARSA